MSKSKINLVTFLMNVGDIRVALLNMASNPDKNIRKKNEGILELYEKNEDFIFYLMELIKSSINKSNHEDLLAAIYLKKYLEKNLK